jgi:hypothetical protein
MISISLPRIIIDSSLQNHKPELALFLPRNHILFSLIIIIMSSETDIYHCNLRLQEVFHKKFGQNPQISW